MRHTIIIAEAGVNHNGSIELAKQLVDKAVVAGVDYIKFQTFKASELVTKAAKQAEYQQKNIGKEGDNQYQMLKKLELSPEDHEVLIAYCQEKGIKFFSTAFIGDAAVGPDTQDGIALRDDLGPAGIRVAEFGVGIEAQSTQ